MTKDQVTLLKTDYMKEAKRPDGKTSTAGEYMRFCLDGNIDFVSSKDCVIFDDTHNLIHCICINDDPRGQAMYPLKVMSADYGIIQQIETVMSRENFEEFLNSGFISKLISEEKKNFLINYARSIRNQALQPQEAEPYYPPKNEPIIIPMHNTRIPRDDELKDENTEDGETKTEGSNPEGK